MPETPIEEQQVSPQVQPSAELPMDATPEAFGAGIGSALETGGEVATKLHHDAWEHANEASVLDADNKLSDLKHAYLTDPKTGLLYQNLGKDAPGAADAAMAAYDKQVSAIQNGLTNDQQHEMFGRHVVVRRGEMQDQLDRWSHEETSRYTVQTYDAQIANRTRDAALASQQGDLKSATDHVNALAPLIEQRGKFLGQSPDTVKELQDQAGAAAHYGVIQQLASAGKVADAKQWYADHLADLGKDAPEAKRLIDAVDLNDQAMKTSDNLVADKDGAMRPYGDVMKDVNAIQDAKLRKEVTSNVDKRFSEDDEAKRRVAADTLEKAYSLGKSNGTSDPSYVTMKAQLPLRLQEELDSALAKPDNVIRTDPVLHNDLTDQATHDPEGFLRTVQDPTLKLKLAPTDYEQVAKWEQQIRANGTIDGASVVRGKQDIVNSALLTAGFGYKNTQGATEIDKLNPNAVALQTQLNERIEGGRQEAAQAKKPYGLADMQKAADQAALDFYFNKKPVTAMTPAERDDATRSLSDLVKTDPDRATQIQSGIRALAVKRNIPVDKLSSDQQDRIYAQMVIAQDLHYAGDKAGAERATARIQTIISEPPEPQHGLYYEFQKMMGH